MYDDGRPGTSSRARSSETVSLCHMLDVFSEPECRALLSALQEREGPHTIRSLTDQVAASGPADDVESRRTDTDAGDVESRRTDADAGDLRARLLAMVGLGILGYDPAADAVWIPDDVALSVRPPGAPIDHSLAETDDETNVPIR